MRASSSLLLLVLAASIAAACRTPTTPPPSTRNEVDAAVEIAPRGQGDAGVTPDASASAAAATPAKKVRARPIGGASLGDILVGEQPSTAHPQGTIIAVASARGAGKGESAGLVEVDVASGNEVRRSQTLAPAVSAAVLAVREGDAIHLVTMQGASIVWITATRALVESRRLVTKPFATTAGTPALIDFAVVDGRGFVVVDSNGAKVLVLDGRGGMATHDCHAHARPGGPTSSLLKVGPWVAAHGLIDDNAGSMLCGVRADGTGKPLVRKLDFALEVFTHGGVAYAQGNDLRRLGDDLTPTGAPVEDPRRCAERADDCRPSEVAEGCEGLTGEGVWKMVSFGRVRVLRTFGCCGGAPGGVFVCGG